MSPIQRQLYLCIYCYNISKFRCKTCGDCYCSKNCQNNDWANHKSFCFELPELIPLDNSAKFYKSGMNAAKNISEEAKPDLIEIDDEIKGEDTLIETIQRKPESDEDSLREMVNQVTINITKSPTNRYISESSEKTSDQYIENNCIEIFKDNCFNGLKLENLKMHKWPNNKNIKVKLQHIIQAPNIMSFVENKKVIDDLYEFMQAEVQKYLPKLSKTCRYLPKTNEIVLAQYNGWWRRACVLDADISGIIIYLIDYGNLALVTISEILRITDQVSKAKLAFEICSKQFIVDNVPTRINQRQKEILESKEMMITNIYVDKNGLFHCEIFGF